MELKIGMKWLWSPKNMDNFERMDNTCNAVFTLNMEKINQIITINGINTRTKDGLTLLHLACKYIKTELVHYLLMNGADCNVSDANGRTPLFYTVHHIRTTIAELLFKNKSKIVRDRFGLEPLYYACSYKPRVIYDYLKPKSKASIIGILKFQKSRNLFMKYLSNLPENIDEFSLISFAMDTGNTTFIRDVVKDLIDVKCTNIHGNTILHHIFLNWEILSESSSQIIQFFENKGANINQLTNEGISLSRIIIKKNSGVELLENIFKDNTSYTWPKDNSNQTDLQFTIRNKQDEYFNWLVKNVPQFNIADRDGNTCLHLAVIHTPDIDYRSKTWKSSYIIKILEECEHHLIYALNNFLKSALDLAKANKKSNMVQLLEELMDETDKVATNSREIPKYYQNIEYVFDTYFLYVRRSDHTIAKLEKAISLNQKGRIAKIIENSECIRFKYDRTILFSAIQYQNLQLAECIVEKNWKDCLKRDVYGNTPFALSRIHGNDIFLYLKTQLKKECGEATFLILSTEADQMEEKREAYLKFIEFCKSYKIDKHFSSNLMRYVCRFNNAIFTKLYTKIGINLEKNDKHNRTPLQSAVEIYHKDSTKGWLLLAKNLLEIGDDIKIKSISGGTLLHLASINLMRDSKELYLFLLGHNVDINEVDKAGQTALHNIIKKNNYSCTEMLFDSCNIDIVDENGNNYLHYSVEYDLDENNVFDCIKKLSIKKNNVGKTPLHIACESGKINKFNVLLSFSPNELLFVRDNNGKTALDYAAENGHYNIITTYILSNHSRTDFDFINFCFDRNGNTKDNSGGPDHEFLECGKSISESKYTIKDLIKIFAEFSVRRIFLQPEFEFNIQRNILESDLIVIDKKKIFQKPVSNKECLKLVQDKVQFIIKIINETVIKLSEPFINIEMYQRIMQIAINIRQLTDKFKECIKYKSNRFFNLPLREMEYVLVSFLTIYSTNNNSDSFVYKVILNKKRIQTHLKKFVESLEAKKHMISIDFLFPPKSTDLNQEILSHLNSETKLLLELINQNPNGLDEIKTKIYGLKALIDKTEGKPEKQRKRYVNPEFIDLNEDFEATRTFYSLSKILRYVDKSVTVDVKNNELGVLVIQRTMQVFGEYIQNSTNTPNVAQKIHTAISFRTKYLKDCIIKIRHDLSHVDCMKNTLDIEFNTDLYTNIQNDLRVIRPFLINLLYDEREECVRKLLRKMFDSKTQTELNDLCFHFVKETDSNLPEYDPLFKVKILVQNLKDILIFKTKEEENIFSKIENIIEHNICEIQAIRHTLDYNFNNPETFLLNTEDEISLGQTKEFLRFGEAPKKCNEPLQPITYFALQIQKLTQDRFIPNFKEVQMICNEILATSLIGVKQKIVDKIIYQNTNEYEEELIKEINLKLKDFEGKIEDVNIRNDFITQLDKYKQINQIFNCLKEFVFMSYITNKQTILLNSNLKKYEEIFLAKKRKIKIHKNSLRINVINKIIETAKEIILIKLTTDNDYIKSQQIIHDKYFHLLNKSFIEKSITIPLKEFLGTFKCLKYNKKDELSKCFIDRVNTFKYLLPDETKYVKYFKSDPYLTMAVEMIVLNLYDMLKQMKMMGCKDEILDCFLPLLSTRTLRNHLAHGDALFDILPFNTEISIFANAFKLINFINESKFNILDANKIIYYSSRTIVSGAKQHKSKMEWIKSQNDILNKVVKCNPIGSLCYFYKIPILRGLDLNGRTIFNLIFDNDPKTTINFFINRKNSIIRSPQLTNCLLKSFNNDFIHMDVSSLCQHLVNKLWAETERSIILTLLIQICALKGFHTEIDEICANSDNSKEYETFLKKNYKTLMNFADKYCYVINVKRYSRIWIPEYENTFSALHLAAAFNHSFVVKLLLNLGIHHVNVTARNNKTALHVASHCGNKDVVDILIRNGADIHAKSGDGRLYCFDRSFSTIAYKKLRRDST